MSAPALVLLACVVLSTRAEAASIFERYHYQSFWSDVLPIIIMVALAIAALIFVVPRMRRQAASAPGDARRSGWQRVFHHLSLIFLVAPMFYGFIFDFDLVLPLWATFTALAVATTASRPLGSRFGLRMMCVLPAGVIAFAAGELVLTWPREEVSLVDTADWTLALSSASFAIGSLLSYISFPAAYRARAW
jgi:hypothetical protein